MTPAELERLLAERPVSAAEYSRQPGNWSNLDMGEVRDRIMAAHRADAPALVRALEAMLRAARPLSMSGAAYRAEALAAFWAAYNKEEPR